MTVTSSHQLFGKAVLSWIGLGIAVLIGAWLLFATSGSTAYLMWKLGFTEPGVVGSVKLRVGGCWYLQSSSKWPLFSERDHVPGVRAVFACRTGLVASDAALVQVEQMEAVQSVTSASSDITQEHLLLKRYPWGEAYVSSSGIVAKIPAQKLQIVVPMHTAARIQDFLQNVVSIERE